VRWGGIFGVGIDCGGILKAEGVVFVFRFGNPNVGSLGSEPMGELSGSVGFIICGTDTI
jgi:hypothetical protein